MKVLLIGEFSGVHSNLKSGLLRQGIHVETANFGDGYRKFNSDWYLGPTGDGKINDLIRNLIQKLYLKRMLKYDVIQFMHPVSLENGKFSNEFIYTLLKKAKLSVVLATGCDCQYAKYSGKLEVSPCPTCRVKDLKNHRCRYIYDKNYNAYERKFLRLVDVIIPTTYDYMKVYNDFENINLYKTASIKLFPMDTQKVKYSTTNNKKIIVYHPLNRVGFKGTDMIKKAFIILKDKYSDKAEFIIKGKMPFNEYYEFVKKVDIVVDQCYCLGYGMGSLYAMAQGKVVVSGHSALGKKDSRTPFMSELPIVDIGYSVEEIVNTVSNLIDNSGLIENLKKEGRRYVCKYHDANKIAEQYIRLYNNEIKKKERLKIYL